jgi:uncharacterized membrane protein YbhN (UPF0104 family)
MAMESILRHAGRSLPVAYRVMTFNKDQLWRILQIATAIGLASIVISEVEVDSISSLWKRISISWLLLSIFAFYASVWSMARRYWVLIGRRVEFHDLFHVVLYQNIMSNLVTTAAGAAWYVAILHTKHSIRVTNCFFSLICARFGDLLTLVASLSLATLVVWQYIPTLHLVVTIVIVFLAAVVLSVGLIIKCRRRLVKIVGQILNRFQLHSQGGVYRQRVIMSFAEFARGEVGESRGRSIVAFTGYSVLTLSTMLLFAYSSLRVFGVPIDIWPVVFVVSLTQIMSLVPIQIFGGLGLYDFAYLYLYGLFGFEGSEFAAVIVGLRVCFYLTNVMLLGVIILPKGLITRLLLRKQLT